MATDAPAPLSPAQATADPDVYVDEFGRTRRKDAGTGRKRERSPPRHIAENYAHESSPAGVISRTGGLLPTPSSAPHAGAGSNLPPGAMPISAPRFQQDRDRERRDRDRPRRSRSREHDRGREHGRDRDRDYGGDRDRTGPGRDSDKGRPRDKESDKAPKAKDRHADHFDANRQTDPLPAEIRALATFPVWMDLRLQDGRLQSSDAPSVVADTYDKFRRQYVADAANKFYAAHRHEEWFRAKYDPVAILASRTRRQTSARATAEEVLRSVTSGAIVGVLPVVGGTYTGAGGLGVGVRQALARASTAGTVSLTSIPQAPVLFMRGVHPSVPVEELTRAVTACSSIIAMPKGPATLMGGGGMMVPTLIKPSDEQLSRAAEAAVSEVSAMLIAAAEGRPHIPGSGEGVDQDGEGEREAKRARTSSDAAAASTPAAPAANRLSDTERTELLASAGLDVSRVLSRLREGIMPAPVAIEMSDPRRLPAIGYRRNVWVEYADVLDAAIARQLLKRVMVDIAGPWDPLASGEELTRVRALAAALGLPLSGQAGPEAGEGEELSKMTLPSLALSDAAGDPPSSFVPKTVTLPPADWHKPTYGDKKEMMQRGGRRDKFQPRKEEDRDPSAHFRGYPYGKPFTVDIPSWASTAEQVAVDLPRALELAAALDMELQVWNTSQAGAKEGGEARAVTGTDGPTAGASAMEESERLYDDDEGRRGEEVDTSGPAGSSGASAPTLGLNAGDDAQLQGAPSGMSADVRRSPLYKAVYGAEGLSLHGYTSLQQLDIAVAYLRYVHCYDFYSGAQGSEAGDLRQAVGDGYRRVAAPGFGRPKAVSKPSSAPSTDAAIPSTKPEGEALDTSALNASGAKEEGEGEGAQETEDATEAGLEELMYGGSAAGDAGKASDDKSGSKPSTGSAPVPLAHAVDSEGFALGVTSDKAQKAFEEWARKHAEHVRGRLAAAKRQIDANQRNRAGDDDTLTSPVAPPPVNPADAGPVPGTTKDGLVPVQGRESKPVNYAAVKAAADRIIKCRERLLRLAEGNTVDAATIPPSASAAGVLLPESVLMAEWFAASTAPDSIEAGNAADGMPPIDPARLAPASVLTVARTVGEPNTESRTRCALCPKKVFKAIYFAVKHLTNKHPEAATAVLDNVVGMVKAAVDLRLAEAAWMRRAYFADVRRPMPWQDPSELKRLLTDTVAAAQRIMGASINLPLYLVALADSTSGSKGRAGNSAIASALGLTSGPQTAAYMSGPAGMLTQLMSMALSGGIAPMGLGMGQMGMGAMGMPGVVGAALGMGMGMGMGGSGGVPSFAPGFGGRGGRGGGRGGQAGGRGGGRGGAFAHGQAGAFGNGNGPEGSGEGHSGPRPPRGGLGGTPGGPGTPGSSFRDRDAVKPAGAALTKPNYGANIVSYDDI